MPHPVMQNPFENFFSDPVYLEYKNHLFNYLARVKAVRETAGEMNGRSLEIGSGVSPVTNARIYTDLSQTAMKELSRTLVNTGHHFYAVTDATRIAFKPGTFQTIILSEVLEHIPEDTAVLSELARVLEPGGRLIITVPVNPGYWGFDDAFVGHQRRYKIDEMRQKVESSGFELVSRKKVGGPVERLGTWLTVKLFLMMNKKKQSQNGSMSTKWLPAYKTLNRFLSAWVRLDARLMPEGLSSIILFECRKK